MHVCFAVTLPGSVTSTGGARLELGPHAGAQGGRLPVPPLLRGADLALGQLRHAQALVPGRARPGAAAARPRVRRLARRARSWAASTHRFSLPTSTRACAHAPAWRAGSVAQTATGSVPGPCSAGWCVRCAGCGGPAAPAAITRYAWQGCLRYQGCKEAAAPSNTATLQAERGCAFSRQRDNQDDH